MAATSQTKEKFEDYDGFVEKFKPKKTTDDCYTPENIYEAVKAWACKEYGINPDCVVRPFWPGKDYQKYPYAADSVVIDNPPFSIISQICKWYLEMGIRFFLFAPYLSNLNTRGVNHVFAPVCVRYDNGAEVSTCFLTNMGEWFIHAAPDLMELIETENKKNLESVKKHLPKYVYPDHVITSCGAGYICNHGVELKLKKEDCYFIRQLDAQKVTKKTLFGSGYLLSEKAAAEKAAAEKAAAEKAAAEKAAAEKWQLSDREWDIVRSLG